MKCQIQKIIAKVMALALLAPTIALFAPHGVYAQMSADYGGSATKVVNGTGSVVELDDLTISTTADGDITQADGVVVQITKNTTAKLVFDITSPVTATPSVNLDIGGGNGVAVPVTPTADSILIPVTTVSSTAGDYIVVSDIKVKATANGSAATFDGTEYLSVTTTEHTDTANPIKVDAKNPVVNLTRPEENKLYNEAPKLEYTAEAGAVVSVKLNNIALTNVQSGVELTNAKEGQDNSLAFTATDVHGNSLTTYRTFKLDKSAPSLFQSPANEIHPGDDSVPYEWLVVFQGNTDAGLLVQLEINSDPIIQKTIATSNGEWRFEVPAKDIGEGTHSVKISATDSAGNVAEWTQTLVINAPAHASKKQFVYASATSGAVSNAVAPQSSSSQTINDFKQNVEDTAEGIVQAAEEANNENANPWQTVVTVIAILIVAIGVGTAGYYGYEWWITRDQAAMISSSGPAEKEKEDLDAPIVAAKKKSSRKISNRNSRTRGNNRTSSDRW